MSPLSVTGLFSPGWRRWLADGSLLPLWGLQLLARREGAPSREARTPSAEGLWSPGLSLAGWEWEGGPGLSRGWWAGQCAARRWGQRPCKDSGSMRQPGVIKGTLVASAEPNRVALKAGKLVHGPRSA